MIWFEENVSNELRIPVVRRTRMGWKSKKTIRNVYRISEKYANFIFILKVSLQRRWWEHHCDILNCDCVLGLVGCRDVWKKSTFTFFHYTHPHPHSHSLTATKWSSLSLYTNAFAFQQQMHDRQSISSCDLKIRCFSILSFQNSCITSFKKGHSVNKNGERIWKYTIFRICLPHHNNVAPKSHVDFTI